MATFDYPPDKTTTGGGGITIGGTITGGSPNEILYGDSTGKIAQSSNLIFDGTNLAVSGNLIASSISIPDNISPVFTVDNAGSVTANAFNGGSGTFGSAVQMFNGLSVSNTLTVDFINGGDIGAAGFLSGGSLIVTGTTSLDSASITTDGAGGLFVQAFHNNGNLVNQGTFSSDGNLVSSNGAGTVIIQALSCNGAMNTAAGTFVTNSTGKLITYNGDTTTDGNGVASILKSVNLTAQTASIGSTTLYTPYAVNSHYLVTVYLVVSTAGTSGTVTATLGWNDGIAARTVVSPTVTFGSLAAPVQINQFIVTNTSAITYLTTVSAAVGTPKYDLHIDVVKLK